jgi:hypothetical protein
MAIFYSKFMIGIHWFSDGKKVVWNEPCGHLLRTKKVGTNEGGVATGYSVLDSPFLE